MTADFNKDTAAKNGGRLTGEYWLAAGMRYDPESIELLISSPIDAVGEIIATATSQGAKAGENRTLSTLRNSRSARSRLGM